MKVTCKTCERVGELISTDPFKLPKGWTERKEISVTAYMLKRHEYYCEDCSDVSDILE